MRLSVVVVFHDMARESARTLHSLSVAHQRDVGPDSYEVIAVDNAMVLHGRSMRGYNGGQRLVLLQAMTRRRGV